MNEGEHNEFNSMPSLQDARQAELAMPRQLGFQIFDFKLKSNKIDGLDV